MRKTELISWTVILPLAGTHPYRVQTEAIMLKLLQVAKYSLKGGSQLHRSRCNWKPVLVWLKLRRGTSPLKTINSNSLTGREVLKESFNKTCNPQPEIEMAWQYPNAEQIVTRKIQRGGFKHGRIQWIDHWCTRHEKAAFRRSFMRIWIMQI